eukprot:TRINITY_DN3567_c0_g1_i2.p1 TRINITY_DN3567_c0_g1~~TRINITY_DN3567_c0_g1_i2.p1  ORF type:complete len:1198 (-),score=214.19 TRINITY_DN3567_c0_g1_i2:59-3133(-)
MGLGRSWNRRPLGQNEAYVSSSALRAIRVRPNRGERISVGIDVKKMLTGIGIGNPDLSTDDYFRGMLTPIIRQAVLTYLNQSQDVEVNTTDVLTTLGYTVPDDYSFMVPNETRISPSKLPPEQVDQMVDRIYDVVLQGSLTEGRLFNEFTVVDEVADPSGKWPDVLGSVVVVEAKFVPYFLKTLLPSNRVLVDALFQSLGFTDVNSQNLDESLDNANINQYAMMVAVGYRDRLDAYLLNNQPRQRKLIDFTNEVSLALGIDYPANFELPISDALNGLGYIRMFLDQIFASTVLILIGLSVMLIYSLLLSDVEDKTFEFGMMRSMGLQKSALMLILVLQSLVYGLPGLVLGLSCSFALNVPMMDLISTYTVLTPNYVPSVQSIVVAFVLGLLMPLVSNILPIKRALSRTLREALDLYHQTVNEVKVTVQRLDDLDLSPWIISVSLFLVLAGFLVYYLLPYCIIFLNIPLFLTILNFILIGMVIGAATVASLIEPLGERVVLFLLLSWNRDRPLSVLVSKSLSGHRPRNQKTAVMLTISLTFIIFSGSMLTLQTGSLQDDVRYGLGSTIVFFTPTRWKPLDRVCVSEFLNKYPLLGYSSDSHVFNNSHLSQYSAYNRHTQNSSMPSLRYSFVSYDMTMEAGVNEIRLSNLGGSLAKRVRLQGVDMDLMKSTYTKYYIPSELAKDVGFETVDNNYDVITSLYAAPDGSPKKEAPPRVVSGIESTTKDKLTWEEPKEVYGDEIEIVISEAMREGAQLDTSRPMQLEIFTAEGQSIKYLCKAHSLLRKAPGFYFSSYKETARKSPVLISMPTYMHIMERVNAVYLSNQPPNYVLPRYYSTHEPSALKVMVRVQDNATRESRMDIVNGLLNCAEDETVVAVDTEEILVTVQSSTDLLIVFFQFVSLVASVVCFFGLWLSFAANIRENSWELGVLRALGLTANQVLRVYIYEALCIVVTSTILGSMIGVMIAVTLTLQSDLFTEMPFAFAFPWSLFGITSAAAVTIAILGSYLPASSLSKQEIAIALRGSA